MPKDYKTKIEEILSDPTASYWLKQQVSDIEERDIVDLFNDILTLKHIARLKLDQLTRKL